MSDLAAAQQVLRNTFGFSAFRPGQDEIVAAILAFAVLGKTSDWMIAAAAAPFLRWEDRFFARGTEP